MTIKDFSFTKINDNRYISETLVPNGDTSIELAFPEKCASVTMEQSLSGDNWKEFNVDYYIEVMFQKNITGILPLQKIRIICAKEPVTAKYLQNE